MMSSIEQEIERIIDQRVKERVKSLTGKEEEIIECLKGFISLFYEYRFEKSAFVLVQKEQFTIFGHSYIT